MLEGARRIETLCRSVEDTLNAPVVQVGTNGAEIVLLHCCFVGMCLIHNLFN